MRNSPLTGLLRFGVTDMATKTNYGFDFTMMFFIAVIAAIFGGVVTGDAVQKHFEKNPNYKSRTVAVCTYLGGHVEGKVCVKGNDIIETRFK